MTRLHASPSRPYARFIPRQLLLVATILLVTAYAACAGDPLGATLHKDGTTTFRVWAPYVDKVAVKIGTRAPLALTKEAGHDDSDTTWSATAKGTKAGNQYRYVIQYGGSTHEFNDPRAQQLSGFDLNAKSVIIDPGFAMPPFTEPTFNALVIYELHIGTFNKTFAGAVTQLDYLKSLGINAIEVLPIAQNPEYSDHTPHDYDWGYDPVQLFAVKAKYGTVKQFKEFVKQCHQRGIAVIVDVVYNHLVGNNLLQAFGGVAPASIPNGIYFYGGERADTGFGPRPDFGRPQVRKYLNDNALLLLRDYGVDGLRFDDTVDIRSFNSASGRQANPEGAQLLREINSSYRDTDPKQPGKITVAEDLQSSGEVTQHSGPSALDFNSQWDDGFFSSIRSAVVAARDQDRNLYGVKEALERKLSGDVFSRVIYTENHDKVGHPENGERRLPGLIDSGNSESVFAKKRSTLAAALLLTAPGIPMLFQGQEMLDNRDFTFKTAVNVDFQRARDPKYSGIVQMYRDLIALRRNAGGNTRGLTGQQLNVFHLDDGNKTLAFHRWENGGAGDDVVVVVNLSNAPQSNLNIGMPRGGRWVVRFNSGAKAYDPGFGNGNSFDTDANPGQKDGMNFNANLSIGPYSVVILSQR